ncbi:MAG: hypothetical protein JW861_03910 [Bacteroidales bacterium]|nr:hypothetical protein [Bacteroidales bacterium]
MDHSEEMHLVRKCLRESFRTASDIFVDTTTRECEVTISVDEYQGELPGYLVAGDVVLSMVDFCDTFPFKYVFSYALRPS